jgi:general stress protein 26
MPIMITEEQRHILDFLREHSVAVLSTADETGKPHGATIYFTFDDQSMNFFFMTKQNTTKNRNLQQNPQAALTVHEAQTQTTAQIVGNVTEEKEPAKTEAVFQSVLSAAIQTSKSDTPPTAKLQAGAYVFYRLIPVSVRLASFTNPNPADYDKIFEVM